MKSKYNFIQVYNVWVNGRSVDDIDQQYPIDTNVAREWHTDLKRAVKDFYNAKAEESNKTEFGDIIYQDFQVNLFSIDIDLDEFEKRFDLDFNINCDKCQEMIPYYDKNPDGLGYDFNTVAERVVDFKR